MNEKHTLNVGGTQIGVYSKGAELCSYKVNGKEFIWEGNPKFWNASSPVLFPFVGVIKDGSYEYDGKKYEIKTRHGFARTEEFELTEKTDSSLKFKFTSNEETLKKYPFEFELYITYTIENDKLGIEYRVVNKSQNKMYFSIGAHPAFRLEINDEIRLEDYYLELEKEEKAGRINLRENGLAVEKKYENNDDEYFLNNENKIDIDKNLFDEDAVIFENLKSEKVAIKCKKDSTVLEMEYKGFPFIAFWSKPGAPFICLEPWYGITDFENSTGRLENKKGIETLDKNGEFKSKLTIKANL